MIVVTAGQKYIDMDAFACMFAYRELLESQDKNVKVVTSAKPNASVTKSYKMIANSFENSLENDSGCRFVIMDVSDPDHFENFVDIDAIDLIFDHHPGFEEFWRDKLGGSAVIEPIGAAATLIAREYEKVGKFSEMSQLSAEVLAVAILSNTLNFRAKIAKDEDRQMYEKLKKLFNYTNDFEAKYFSEVQHNVESDIENALIHDSKQINPNLFIAQLEVWDPQLLFDHFETEIRKFLRQNDSQVSFLNIIGFGSGYNLLVFNDTISLESIKEWFPEFMYDTKDLVARTSSVLLRKEILTRMLNSKS